MQGKIHFQYRQKNHKNLKTWKSETIKKWNSKQNFPNKAKYNNESLKIPPLSSCSVGRLLLGMSPALTCGLYTQWGSPGKRSFFILCGYQVEITSWLGMWDDVHVPISILVPYVVWTCNSPKHAFTASRCSFVWQSCYGLKTLFPWCPPFPMALIIFLPCLLHCSMSPERRIWWRSLI